MVWKHVQGNWAESRSRIKQRWSRLTEDDLNHIDGSRDRLRHLIQERYQAAKEQVDREMDEWASSQDAGDGGERGTPK
ncbi:MAG: CsbD family protein [Gemmatimonadota bacterium]|nr:CsbD family protein [Gemmatimonadota bacterium]